MRVLSAESSVRRFLEYTPDEKLKIIDVEILYNLLKDIVEDLSKLKKMVLR